MKIESRWNERSRETRTEKITTENEFFLSIPQDTPFVLLIVSKIWSGLWGSSSGQLI